MKYTIQRCIALLLCLNMVLFVMFRESSFVKAENTTFNQMTTAEETAETAETFETAESVEESAEESAEETLESVEETAEETVEETSEETVEETAEETPEETRDGETGEFKLHSTSLGVQNPLTTNVDVPDNWVSYYDYIISEATRSWNKPDLYVGSTAEFNALYCSSFACVPNVDVIDFGSDGDVSGGDAVVSDDADFNDNGYDFYEKLSEFAEYVDIEDVLDAEGNSIKVVITEAYFDDTLGMESLWYKVEAAEGYTLPDILAENPYVLHLTYPEDYPSLLMLPRMGMFVGDTVSLQYTREGTERPKEVAATAFPDFFDVTYLEYRGPEGAQWTGAPWIGYDLSAIPEQEWPEGVPAEYHYVTEKSVVLIPAEVSRAYVTLMNAESSAMYEAIWSYIPEEVTSQFTSKHLANLEAYAKHLYEIENVEKKETVAIGDANVEVTVHGKIPMDATLSVSLASTEDVMNGGFDIESESEIITALDIKIFDKDGVEWQPEEGELVNVSIDMAALGFRDGDIVRLHHQHGEDITVFEIFIVMDGKVTVGINGFSLFVISDDAYRNFYNNFGNTGWTPTRPTGTPLHNPGNGQATQGNPIPIELEIGESVVYYAGPRTNENLTTTNRNYKSTWWVTDPNGAIFYEVYSDKAAGSYGVNGQWIRVTALKSTWNEEEKKNEPIELRYVYSGSIPNEYSTSNPTIYEQYYNLSIVVPKATSSANDVDKYKLYVKDEVNKTGRITATLVDVEGNEVTKDVFGEGSDDITYSWTRNDGVYIIPNAYKSNGKSIDICVDHAGLLQNRLTNVTYTVTATLPNGIKKTATYTVYYQSEILNADFENPTVQNRTYTFLTNGWPGLYWKTTSPGTGINLSRDVEFANYGSSGNGSFTANNNNVTFYPNRPSSKIQVAEINAENFGALYQDIITAPGEDVEWKFDHARRDADNNGEAMYLIIGPTEDAQQYTSYADLDELLVKIETAAASAVAGTEDGRTKLLSILNGTQGYAPGDDPEEVITGTFIYNDPDTGAKYQLWYHNADTDTDYNTPDKAWKTLQGSYNVPTGQYRTRLFFVTDPHIKSEGRTAQYGNLIDSSFAGTYVKYLIEYYEETFDEETSTMTYDYLGDNKDTVAPDQSGTVIMYSSVELESYKNLERLENDMLGEVRINGAPSPYNLKYYQVYDATTNKDEYVACLFIEKYATTVANIKKQYDTAVPLSKYKDYDIVMQVFVRDTAIAVQKRVAFPAEVSSDQKQKLIDELIGEESVSAGFGQGYEASFELYCKSPECNKLFADKTVAITKNDPTGWYTGYTPMGDNPKGTHSFKLTETHATPLKGLELAQVDFDYYTFNQGIKTLKRTKTYTNVGIVQEKVGKEIEYRVVNLDESPGATQEVVLDNITFNTVPDTGTEYEGVEKLVEVRVTNTYREKTVKIHYEAVGPGGFQLQDVGSGFQTTVTDEFLYYSGTPHGVIPKANEKYFFAGWYLDEACTEPVTSTHGYVDKNNVFVPNKNKVISDDMLEVTYYAKFSIGSLQIIRENAEPGQVFVYQVTGAGQTMYVSVVIGADGKGSTEIIASCGANNEGIDYTITELDSWSWRYDDGDALTQKHKYEAGGLHQSMKMTTVYKFDGNLLTDYWLNGNSSVKTNKFGKLNIFDSTDTSGGTD